MTWHMETSQLSYLLHSCTKALALWRCGQNLSRGFWHLLVFARLFCPGITRRREGKYNKLGL